MSYHLLPLTDVATSSFLLDENRRLNKLLAESRNGCPISVADSSHALDENQVPCFDSRSRLEPGLKSAQHHLQESLSEQYPIGPSWSHPIEF